MRYRAAIFDMDGTLLDTAEDMRRAMTYAFKENGYLAGREFERREVESFFGSGVTVAVERAFDALRLPHDRQKMAEVEQVYRPFYEAHCAECTAPYPGIVQLLRRLGGEGVACAAVSNKPDPAVRELCQRHFPDLFSFVQGENIAGGIRRKPAPDMTERALAALGTAREQAVYIGDSEVDIQTARVSRIPCISVLWGFRSREYLLQNGGKIFVENCDELYAEFMR